MDQRTIDLASMVVLFYMILCTKFELTRRKLYFLFVAAEEEYYRRRCWFFVDGNGCKSTKLQNCETATGEMEEEEHPFAGWDHHDVVVRFSNMYTKHDSSWGRNVPTCSIHCACWR